MPSLVRWRRSCGVKSRKKMSFLLNNNPPGVSQKPGQNAEDGLLYGAFWLLTPDSYQLGVRMQTLMQRITDRSAHVSVIGLGYAGLPLAIGFAQAGYQVTGIDTDPQKIIGIQTGISHV